VAIHLTVIMIAERLARALYGASPTSFQTFAEHHAATWTTKEHE
jgi:hypothetical protein